MMKAKRRKGDDVVKSFDRVNASSINMVAVDWSLSCIRFKYSCLHHSRVLMVDVCFDCSKP